MKYYKFLILCCAFQLSWSQTGLNSFLKPSDSLHKGRFKAVLVTEGSLVGVSLIGLNQLWYANYPKSKFHTINDSDEWLQMDKLGHTFSAYQLSRLGAQSFEWAGANKNKQLV